MIRRTLALVFCSLAPLSHAAAQDAPGAGLPGGAAFRLPTITIGASSAQTLLALLRRPEVVNHLHLSVKQQNELADLVKNRQGTRIQINADQKSDPDSIHRQIQDQIEAQRMSLDERLKAILKPEQYTRLTELSLQWTGPIAMADPKIADELKLTRPGRSDIGRIVGDYNQKKMQIMMAAAQTEDNSSPDGSRVARMVKIDSTKIAQPGTESYKKLTALKTEAETKIMALLSDDEKNAWKTAQGDPFTFRTDTPGFRF